MALKNSSGQLISGHINGGATPAHFDMDEVKTRDGCWTISFKFILLSGL
jgi:hypothetical protein